MSDSRKAPAARAVTCPRCGALNSPDFGKCIRCASALPRDGAAVTASAASSPSARQRADRSGEDVGEHHYWATKTLIWATLVIFAGQVLASIQRGEGVPILSGGHPADVYRFGAMVMSPKVAVEEPFRLLSCVFVHFGLVHFGMNMMGLVNFARVAEPAIGSARFAIVYVASGLVGSAATIGYTAVAGPGGVTAGASGAVFGVMGLLLGWMIRRRNPAWKQFALQAVVYSVLFGFAVNASRSGMRINNAAHLGGLVCGVLFGLFYGGPTPRRFNIAANIAAGVCLLACLASLVLSQLSPVWRVLDSPNQRTSHRSPVPSALPVSSPVFAAPPSNRSIAPRGPTV